MASYNVYKQHNIIQKEHPFEYLPDLTDSLDDLSNKMFNAETILQITLWKINRYPENVKEIVNIINSIKDGGPLEENLDKLVKIKGVGLPMASAYLRFCNPQEFQIIDVRALRAAFDYQPKTFDENNECFPLLRTSSYEVYSKYLNKLKEIAQNGYHGLYVDYCNLDRFLYDVDKAFGHKLDDNTPNAAWKKMIALKDKNGQADFILNILEEK